ncbi:MAG: F0F1 ATP synthase subunit delta [Chloroflexi bacterium]|nr:F0F1 ATP synthase subunit delta [Chloroflexota bacterium]
MAIAGRPRRYAEALFQLAKQRDTIEAWGRGLDRAAQLLDDEHVLLELSNPELDQDQVKALLPRLLGIDVAPEVVNMVGLLIRRQHLGILRRISELYRDLRDREQNVRRAVVRSAVPLSAEELAQLEQRLTERTKASAVLVEQVVDPKMVGGLVVRVGDLLIDDSINARLDALRTSLLRSR